jgi:prenyltransferase beta subunit
VLSGAFLASLLLSIAVVQAFSGAFTETRRSVLTNALENCQVTGSSVSIRCIQCGDILTSLKILGVQNSSAVDSALWMISSGQDSVGGGYAGYGYKNTGSLLGDDLASTYYAVSALKAFNALDRINQTLLVDFVLNRYNSSSGAFHELTTKVFNQTFAPCNFQIVFHNDLADVAFAIPNVIDTFFGVSILKDLNALSLINVTRTLQWMVSDQVSNGGFGPYPYAEPEYLPGWSSLIQNPFACDDAGAGIPYTYAATGVLKTLGAVDLVDSVKARDYILSCQSGDNGMFAFYYGDTQDTYDFYYTYYAIVALSNLDMLNETSERIQRVNDIVLEEQILGLNSQWPVPTPQDLDEEYWPNFSSHPKHNYGFFLCGDDLLYDTEQGLEVLNATGGLALLNQPTPRVLASRLNLIELSVLVFLIPLILLVMIWVIPKARKAWAWTPKTDDHATPKPAT